MTKDKADRPAQTKRVRLGPLRHEPLELFDEAFDFVLERRERRNDRLSWNTVNFAKEYVRGRMDAVICINAKSARNLEASNSTNLHRPNVDRITLDALTGRRVDQEHVTKLGKTQDGGERGMLVRVVERVDGVEPFPVTRWVDREVNEEVLRRLNGCYRSTRTGFKIYPRPADGQLGFAVLCSAVYPDEFPHQVIHDAAQIVDGIPEKQREVGPQRPVLYDFDPDAPSVPAILTLGLNARTVWARVDERSKGSIEITDVLLGPF